MEKNELISREELKTYFKTGKYPTQSQFSNLIDSFKHKGDVLTNKEVVIIANSLAAMTNGAIQYNIMNDSGELHFSIVVSQQDAEDQIIEIDNTKGEWKRTYFFGNAPYNITAKEFSAEALKGTEYYNLYYQIHPDYAINRLFGNSLPMILDGFEFGTLEVKSFYLQINKIDLGQKINIVNTNIKFNNKTEIPIQYRIVGGNWSHIYTNKDIITDHYDIWDYLTFYYRADLREINQNIECKVYDADNDTLLMTSYLNAGQDNQNVFSGSSAMAIRNIRIECDYQII
ncbi:hypothetical protein GCM10023210_04100 [Chryseobacterium ginsengisoli]|uniref:Uncharacterized protein n=1 Tax=Chryseobacterium ginsengisoli TaxID=363853 RepID=A0ABP9LS07_9FLAO